MTETASDPVLPRQVLSGIRVIDLTRTVAGEFCTKIFADFGAEVIKVERPGTGSLTRWEGPFPDDVIDPERSALFLHLNTNKRSIALDFENSAGREVLLDLTASADLVVESFRPRSLERHGLGPSELQEVNPRVSVTRISNFGQTGPYRDHEATSIVLEAFGGPMNATGMKERPPQRKPGHLALYTVGRFAAVASMGNLMWARRTGKGAMADVAAAEVLLSGADRRAAYLLTGAYSGENAPRGHRSVHRGSATFTGPFPCRDGFVMIYVTTAAFWDRLIDLIHDGDEDFRSYFRGRQTLDTPEEWSRFMDGLLGWLARHDKVEIMTEAEARRIPVTAILDVGEVFHHEHYRERGSFVSAEHPRAGSLDYPGAPWRMRDGWALGSTAPLLGADTGDILDELGVPQQRRAVLRAEGVI
ncbi:MAG: frc 1 [Frankiales bacterium]|nr:frc 1 [Frankiales bacterium]